MKTIITLLLSILLMQVLAQSIGGKVLDEKREPVVSALIQVYSAGIFKGGAVTDYDGNYVVKPLHPGYYDIVVSYSRYDTITITQATVMPDKTTTQNFVLSKRINQPKNNIKPYVKPLIDIDKPTSHVFGIEDLNVTTGGIPDLISINPDDEGFYHRNQGKEINIGGTRASGTPYIIDGDPFIVPTQLIGCPQATIWFRSPFDYTFTREELAKLPIGDLRDAVALLPGIYQSRHGADLNIFGARTDGAHYIIDGIDQRRR